MFYRNVPSLDGGGGGTLQFCPPPSPPLPPPLPPTDPFIGGSGMFLLCRL